MNILPDAVLFDFDGVVVNSFKSHQYAWSTAFRNLFHLEMSNFPFNKDLEGKAPIIIAEYYAKLAGDESRALEFRTEKHRVMAKGEVSPELLPGVKRFTSFLKKNKVPYGIASNASNIFVGQSIKKLDIDFPIFTGYEDYVKPKPAPEAYLALAKKLGISNTKSSTIWVFEDSITGISAARNAGMIPYGIGTQTDLLKEHGALKVFQHLNDACDYLLPKK